jgi:GTP1/Obg family GTP-binding protein
MSNSSSSPTKVELMDITRVVESRNFIEKMLNRAVRQGGFEISEVSDINKSLEILKYSISNLNNIQNFIKEKYDENNDNNENQAKPQ